MPEGFTASGRMVRDAAGNLPVASNSSEIPNGSITAAIHAACTEATGIDTNALPLVDAVVLSLASVKVQPSRPYEVCLSPANFTELAAGNEVRVGDLKLIPPTQRIVFRENRLESRLANENAMLRKALEARDSMIGQLRANLEEYRVECEKLRQRGPSRSED